MIKSESSIFTTFRFYYYYFFVGSVSGLFVPVHLLFGPSLRSVPHDYWQWADGTRRMTRGERNPRNRKRLLISYFLRFLWRLLLSSFPSSIRSDRGTEVSEMGMGWVSLRSSHGTVITSERWTRWDSKILISFQLTSFTPPTTHLTPRKKNNKVTKVLSYNFHIILHHS